MRQRTFQLGLALAVLAPSAAAAQTLVVPAPRQGYFVGLSSGGSAQLNWDESLGALPLWLGGGGSLRLGQAFDSNWSLGLFVDFTWAAGKRREGISSGLGVELGRQLGEGWLVTAGVGLGFARLTDSRFTEADTMGGFGTRVRLSAQRDFFPWTRPLGGSLALAPLLAVEILPADGFRGVTVSFGVQATFWTGLSRDRLELPVDEAFGTGS